MGKFSKIFHHIESKDLKNKYEQKKAAKIQEEKEKKEFKKYLDSTMETKKYNWREGMTTSDVATLSLEKLPNDGDVSTVDTTIDTTFAAIDPLFTSDPGYSIGSNEGTVIRDSGSGTGSNGGFNVDGKYLAFQGTGSGNGGDSRWAVMTPVDASQVDTFTITAIVGNGSNGGETPDDEIESLSIDYKTPDMEVAIPLNFTGKKADLSDAVKVSDDSTAVIIPLGGSKGAGLNQYSVTLPEYARKEGTVFVLTQAASSGAERDNYGITQVKLQRRTPMSVVVPLDNPEASSFIRGAEQGSTPKKRKKDVDDQLAASDQYTKAKFGDEFPGQEVRVGGEDPFRSAKIGDDVKPSPQGKDEVKKSFSKFANQADTVSPQTTDQPETEPKSVAPSAQATMTPTTEDGEEIPIKPVGGKNSGVVQGADAATLDAQEPETTEPETIEPETIEPETIEPEEIKASEEEKQDKTPEEVKEIENEKFNAKADESANAIDKLINFRLDQGLTSFNAIAQVTGVAVNAAINVASLAMNVLGMKEANGFISMLGKIQNSVDIARSVLSGKVTNANVLSQEIRSFTNSMKPDEFKADKIFISDVRHEYADANIYVKDGKVYSNRDGDREGVYATPLANQEFEALGIHGSGYAQMIIPKDGSEPYIHYYDHNYENLNNISDVSATGGIISTIKSDLEYKDGAGALFKSISNIIHQLKTGNTKFIPQKLRGTLLQYFMSFDQVLDGLKTTSSIEGFPPGIHGSALTDFKVPLSKLPQETQDMIAKHPLSWTPERIENMSLEQIQDQLNPFIKTEAQFEDYIKYTSDITKMSTEPVNTVPYAVAMQEMDKVYEPFEEMENAFNDELQKGYTDTVLTDAERAVSSDYFELNEREKVEIAKNQEKLGPGAQSALWDKIVGPTYKAFSAAIKKPGGASKAMSDKIKSQYAKYKKQADKMDADYYRIQREIMNKYDKQREPIAKRFDAYIQGSSYDVIGFEGLPVNRNKVTWDDYTALDGKVYTSRYNITKAYVDERDKVYAQLEALYKPVADLQKYVDGSYVREGISQQFEKDYGFSGDSWSPAKSGDGKPRGGSGKPKSKPDPRFSYAGTGADAATFSFGRVNNKKKKQNEETLLMYARPQSKRGDLFEKVKSKGFFNPNDIKPTFPENPPPQLDPKTGMHPQYGKKVGRYKKLDPISANSMPPTGDPEIDAVVNKQKTINKIKKMARNK